MQALELRIPPPAVAVVIAAGMWLLARLPPVVALPQSLRTFAALPVAVAGIGLTFAGVLSFRQARTTMNPMQPQAAAALVRSGVYRV